MVSLIDTSASRTDLWPGLPLDEWRQTRDTLHMWMQIVGKVRLALSPRVNHWWNVPLYFSPRGLTTSAMPYHNRSLEIAFDFLDHNLVIDGSDGRQKVIPLIPRSVADFYREFMNCLHAMDVDVHLWKRPVEISDPIDFDRDDTHASYDAEYAARFWRILLQSQPVFEEFRSRFIGKCSPVHFFWGSMDLAVTRFNGRLAPQRPEADAVQREAYSHECISHGFWPGGAWFGTDVTEPIYYSYTVPEPSGLRDASIRPAQARFDADMGEFVMPYDAARQSPDPRATLMEFLQSTYDAGADRAGWDRMTLERGGRIA